MKTYITHLGINTVTGNNSSIPGEEADGLLIQALIGVVVTYWSQDSELHQEHINGSHHKLTSSGEYITGIGGM